MQDDPWKMLGVQPGAGLEEVRRAFRRRARELHPDFRPEDPQAEEKFKRLVDALIAATSARRQRPAEESWKAATDGSAPTRRGRRPLGVVADFAVSLAEAIRGGPHVARLRFQVPCRCRSSTATGSRASCSLCGGRGVRCIQRRVTFRLPPGTRDGDTIHVAGPAGDERDGRAVALRIRIRVRLPPGVWIEEDDLHAQMPLTIPEALAGTRVDLVTPLGHVTVTVPAGTDGRTVLRVPAHGLPSRPGSSGRAGDLLLHPIIVVPAVSSEEHLRAAATLASAYPRHPRADWSLLSEA